jgi:hypothetical protein
VTKYFEENKDATYLIQKADVGSNAKALQAGVAIAKSESSAGTH